MILHLLIVEVLITVWIFGGLLHWCLWYMLASVHRTELVLLLVVLILLTHLTWCKYWILLKLLSICTRYDIRWLLYSSHEVPTIIWQIALNHIFVKILLILQMFYGCCKVYFTFEEFIAWYFVLFIDVHGSLLLNMHILVTHLWQLVVLLIIRVHLLRVKVLLLTDLIKLVFDSELLHILMNIFVLVIVRLIAHYVSVLVFNKMSWSHTVINCTFSQ